MKRRRIAAWNCTALFSAWLLASCVAPVDRRSPSPDSSDVSSDMHGPGIGIGAEADALVEPGGSTPGEEAVPRQASHQFERADDWVARFEGPDRDDWQRPEEVVALMGIEPGMTVADLGTGTGYFLPYLSRKAGETGSVLALDVEPDMIRHVDERVERQELFNVRPRVVSVDDPALPSASTDRVLIVNTWHHIGSRDRYAAKLAALLVPGGEVYIVDFTPESPQGPPPSERLASESVAAELRAAGLETEVLTESLPYQYVVVGRRR